MRRYIIPHALPETETKNPDPSLCEQGKQQAKQTAERLAGENFSGTIYTSPYRAAMETAQIIAARCQALFYPLPALACQMPFRIDRAFPGLSLDEMKTLYPAFSPFAKLDYPWWPEFGEARFEVDARIAAALPKVDFGGRELIFICHADSESSLLRHYAIPRQRGIRAMHCCITMFEPARPEEKGWFRDCTHLPPELQTPISASVSI